mgnify:CR=1 FL=1
MESSVALCGVSRASGVQTFADLQKRETLMGLAGLGDLTLTCNSRQSRNMSLGVALGEGKTLAQATEGKRSIAEGAAGAASVHALAQRVKIEMPIVSAVNDILHHGARVERALHADLAGRLQGRVGFEAWFGKKVDVTEEQRQAALATARFDPDRRRR